MLPAIHGGPQLGRDEAAHVARDAMGQVRICQKKVKYCIRVFSAGIKGPSSSSSPNAGSPLLTLQEDVGVDVVAHDVLVVPGQHGRAT